MSYPKTLDKLESIVRERKELREKVRSLGAEKISLWKALDELLYNFPYSQSDETDKVIEKAKKALSPSPPAKWLEAVEAMNKLIDRKHLERVCKVLANSSFYLKDDKFTFNSNFEPIDVEKAREAAVNLINHHLVISDLLSIEKEER